MRQHKCAPSPAMGIRSYSTPMAPGSTSIVAPPVYQIPYGWRVEYEPLSERVRQFGPYRFRYQLLSERLEQVGACKIEYELLSERIRRIRDYSIRYDLLSNRITEFGSIRINYDPFTERIRGVSGTAPGVEIQFLRDGGGRPQPFL